MTPDDDRGGLRGMLDDVRLIIGTRLVLWGAMLMPWGPMKRALIVTLHNESLAAAARTLAAIQGRERSRR